MQLEVGMPAPEFTLPLATGGTISLANMRGKPVVLYFYPKDDTPGCTTEACSFRDNLPHFGNFDAAIIGISKDTVESHRDFIKKYSLNFHLASDAESKTCEAYGVWVHKNNYGKSYMGIERTTFLIDEKGVIRHIWRRVSVEGHAAEVLGLVERLRLGQPLTDEPPAPEPAAAPPAKKTQAAKTTAPAVKKAAVPKKPAAPAKPATKKQPKAASKPKPAAKKPTKPASKASPKKTAAKKAAPKKTVKKAVSKKSAAVAKKKR